ncbi:hypothetical protein [Longimicrobium sp.]|uniref:hypothetical protein n=1 Tax=Longimicrobium sp. TaxID=2029185 RepID=UPI002EDB3E45
MRATCAVTLLITSVEERAKRMGTAGLTRALQQGVPLIEVVVRLRPGADFAAATDRINALADDFDLDRGDGHGDPALRMGTATREALDRLLGWRLVRVPLERYDEAGGVWTTWPDAFRWQETNDPRLDRFPLAGLIESIEITQPGAYDAGQAG